MVFPPFGAPPEWLGILVSAPLQPIRLVPLTQSIDLRRQLRGRIALWVTLVDLLFYFLVVESFCEGWMIQKIWRSSKMPFGWLPVSYLLPIPSPNLPAHLRCLHGSVRTNTSRILPENSMRILRRKQLDCFVMFFGLWYQVKTLNQNQMDKKKSSVSVTQNPWNLPNNKNSSRNINGTTINTHSPKRELAKSDTKTVIMLQWYPFCVGRIFRPPPVLRSTWQRESWDHSFTDLTDDLA